MIFTQKGKIISVPTTFFTFKASLAVFLRHKAILEIMVGYFTINLRNPILSIFNAAQLGKGHVRVLGSQMKTILKVGLAM